MNLLAMRTEVRSRIAETATTFYSDAEINGWLNAGQLDLAQRLPNETLHTLREISESETIAGVQTYSLPADFLRWRGVSYEGTPCRMIGFEELRAINGGNVFWTPTASDPAAFVWKTLDIYPKPTEDNKKVSLYYVKRPTQMTGDAAECSLPKELHEAVIFYACAIAHSKDQNYDAAAHFRQAYQDVIANYTTPPAKQPPTPSGGA